MGDYINQADLSNRFGTDNITEWSDLDNDGDSQAVRIAEAIAWGEQHVNDRFRGSQYAVPLSLAGNAAYIAHNWMATFAGLWLYESRGRGRGETDKLREMEDLRDATEREISRYLTGEIELDADESQDNGPTAPMVFA